MDITTIYKDLDLHTDPKRKQEESVEVLEIEDKNHTLVLHNDDVNTFDFVIDSLIEICEHNPIQAEQCTWLIHYKGKCDVKSGSMDELMPRHQKLLSRGLTSEIV